jgi:uncharacterized Zn finger protein
MECERCEGKLKVTHSYRTPEGRTQRLECPECLLVHTAAVVLVNVDPKRGEGALALSKKLAAGGEIPWKT